LLKKDRFGITTPLSEPGCSNRIRVKLTQVNARKWAALSNGDVQEESPMQIANAAILFAIVAAFVTYGAVLAWANAYAPGEGVPGLPTREKRGK
jgi:hypothetical protein